MATGCLVTSNCRLAPVPRLRRKRQRGSIVRCPAATPRWCATGCWWQPVRALEWLPQETILFDRCVVDRRLDVELADDARFLAVESLVFGRAAMGEQVGQAWLRDGIRIRRDGRWLLHESVRLDGEVDAALRRPAIAGGARAMATLVHVAPDAETASGRRAGRVCRCGRRSGRQCWNGMLVARILARDAAVLRRVVVATYLSCARVARCRVSGCAEGERMDPVDGVGRKREAQSARTCDDGRRFAGPPYGYLTVSPMIGHEARP